MPSVLRPGLLDGLTVLGHELQSQGSWLQVSCIISLCSARSAESSSALQWAS